MKHNLFETEIRILRCLNGEDVPGVAWGAAMGEAVERLQGHGYVARKITAEGLEYVITDKGREAIAGGA
jgi:hypothetical protein